MPNVQIFRIELQNPPKYHNRIMPLSGIRERYGQVCQDQLMIRCDPPSRLETCYGIVSLAEAM